MLARYKILERIGTGGIGVVYLAEDLTLKRKVAVKFLSEESFQKEHTRARFQREARLAASLNHPNICTVHEVGEAASGDERILGGNPDVPPGTPFIVMEWVEGRSLDEIVKEDGPMPSPELLAIAIQIADGLTEAHAQAIVHRDLKPKNVMVTPSGRVKILDFGMAKPLEPARKDDAVMRTTEASSIELTREGMVLGTVAYMSPEQASGKPVDSRSDVFSFGIMLYEMATGRKPFEGDSLTSTLAKILETEPRPLIDWRSDVAPEFSRIIHRCLRKHREDRYNDTRDLAVALKDFLQETSSGAVRRLSADASVSGQVPAAPTKGSRAWLGVAMGIAVIASAVALAFLVSGLTSKPFQFVPPSFQQMTFSGAASYPTLAPDGQSLAYVAGRPGGRFQVVIQDLVGRQQLPILEASWVRSLRWSPGGAELLVSGSSMDGPSQTFLVSRLGGATRPLRYFPFVAWAPDGSRFAGATLADKQIWFTEIATGSVSSIDLDGSFSFIYEIDWSPAGTLLAFRTTDEDGRHAIRTVTADGQGQQVVIVSADALHSPRFSPQGDAVYYLSGNKQAKKLHKMKIDPATGTPDGQPILLLSGLQAGGQVAFSSNGKRLMYAREASHANLWMVKRQAVGEGVTTQQLTFGTFEHAAPRFSPDGSRLALTRKSVSSSNIFVMSLEEREPRQLTFLTDDVWQPVWSADGLSIAFGTTVGGEPRVWKIEARGGTPEPYSTSSLSRDLAWSPGTDILYQRPGDSAFHFLDPDSGDESGFMDDSGGGAADPFQFFSWMASPEYSPDGTRVAISCNCPGGEGVWVVSTDGSSQTLVHDDSELLPVGWSADGRWVYAQKLEAQRVVRIPSRRGAAEMLLDIPFERVGEIDIAPDGTQVVCVVPVSQSDIWLIENFDPELN